MIICGIVAGGKGTRMKNRDFPKQFFDLCGKPVIIHTIEKFLLCKKTDYIVVGINSEWKDCMKDIKEKYLYNYDNIFITDGGNDRNDTIMNIISFAKKKLLSKENDIILTHDAVRPFVTQKIIQDNINSMQKFDVCTTVIPATDTIICSEDTESISDFPIRSTMFQEQTPQTFRIKDFEKVYNSVTSEQKSKITDACKLFYLNNYRVGIVNGDISNIKLTYPLDYELAKIILKTLYE